LRGMVQLCLVGTKRWLSADPDRTKRVLLAIRRGMQAIHDPEISTKTRDAIRAKYFPQLDPKIFDSAWERVKPAFPNGPRIPQDAMQRNVDFLKEFSDQKYRLDPAKVYTNAYNAD
jgi:hypothetical protein